jgi:hypothetical protein
MSDGSAVKLFADAAAPQDLAVKDSNGWVEEIAYFLDCVRNGRQTELCMPESSALSIRLAEVERESIQRHAKVACDI